MNRFGRVAFVALAVHLFQAAPALAEPTEPVVIGWWSYFTPEGAMYRVPTTSPNHPVTSYGDPDTYYYETSGGRGLQEDPNVLSRDQAWQNMISFILANTNSASLSADFTIDTSSDLNQFTEAYFGWALVLLYVPKDKYCDSYRIHIGNVDDGVQAMANAHILGYSNLGDQDKYIDMVEYQTGNLVLRPGINEVILIHEDQQAVQRYVHNVWLEHDGNQIPLEPKSIVWGRVSDAASMKPVYESTVSISGNGVNDTFATGPFGFYFFGSLQDGMYTLSADAAGYQTATGAAAVMMGQAATEVVRVDLPLPMGCSCPNGKSCGPSGGCLDPCIADVDATNKCADARATCVNGLCVKTPCDTLTCAPGFRCEPETTGNPPVVLGVCREIACSNVCCGAGQICSGGLCVMDNCAGGCGAGQTCAGGNCVDACSVLTCVSPLACVAGVCKDPCVANPAQCQHPDAGVDHDAGMQPADAAVGPMGGVDMGGGGGGGALKSGCSCRLGARGPIGRAPVTVCLMVVVTGAICRRRRSRAARS